MSEVLKSPNYSNKDFVKNSIVEYTSIKNDNNPKNSEYINKNKKNLIQISTSNNNKEANFKSHLESKNTSKTFDQNFSNQKSNLGNQTNNIYREIKRPLNKQNSNKGLINVNNTNNNSNNINYNYIHHRNYGDKIQNLDILEHTENSFNNPETDAEVNISRLELDHPIKLEGEIISENENESEKGVTCEGSFFKKGSKMNNSLITKNNINNAANSSGININYNNEKIDSNAIENNLNCERNIKISYRFESPVNIIENSNNNNVNVILPEIKSNSKKIVYVKNPNSVKVLNNSEDWDRNNINKSYSVYIHKPGDKVNQSMHSSISNLNKSNIEKKLKINITNGIIDINQYDNSINNSAQKNELENNEIIGNINSDFKENDPTINFISSVKNNKKFLQNYDKYFNSEKSPTKKYEHYKISKIESEEKNFKNEILKKNNKQSFEKIADETSSNIYSGINAGPISENIGESDILYNDFASDKQYTFEQQTKENNMYIKNLKDNNGGVENGSDNSHIKRHKSGTQSFLQLSKSDVNKIVQNRILKEAANKDQGLNISIIKNDPAKLLKISQSSSKLIQISELTEDTLGNKNTTSPKNRRKRTENNVIISKNSLYMEKVLFFVDNLEKTNKLSPKFEDEFVVLKANEDKGTTEFEKKYIVPPNYINLKSTEIIEKNKSLKNVAKKNGSISLFDIFSNETLDNYNRDKQMANDIYLKDKYFNNNNLNPKVKFNNNSFNLYNKNYNLNTSLNKKNLNNSHQINNHSSMDNTYGEYKIFENSNHNTKPLIRKFIPEARIFLREDITKFDKERKADEALKETFNKTNRHSLESSTKYIKENENNFLEKSQIITSYNPNNSKSKYVDANNFENKKTIQMKNSPLIMNAGNILNMKNVIENSEFENQNIINQSSFFNKSNYSQDLKNYQNEYWLKRRSEPNKYINNSYNNMNNVNNITGNMNNSNLENINIFNETLNNMMNTNYFDFKNKDGLYRSSELEMKKAIFEKSKFENLKNINDKSMDVLRHQKKIEFKKDVILNRKKMDVLENSIKEAVVVATHKARDSMDIFMLNSFKDELIKIEK